MIDAFGAALTGRSAATLGSLHRSVVLRVLLAAVLMVPAALASDVAAHAVPSGAYDSVATPTTPSANTHTDATRGNQTDASGQRSSTPSPGFVPASYF